jgi:hypothetical protein
VIWEASEKTSGLLSADQAVQLSSSLQNGGRLLLTLNDSPGMTPVRLGNILPTTSWATQVRLSPYTTREPLSVSQTDLGFFSHGLSGLIVPFCLDIRTASAVERGQARYERYDFVHPWLHSPIAAGSDYWSRSLLNREWKVRAKCSDFAQMPLVITGRYGAGKVAVVATSAAGIGTQGASRAFWDSLFRWLGEDEHAGTRESIIPSISTSVLGGEVHVSLGNPSSAPLSLQVVLRTLSEHGALLADGSGELQRKVTIAPRKSFTLKLPLPEPSPISDEGLQTGKPVRLRVGVLSESGAKLFAEKRMVSPEASLQLEIQTDNLYSLSYPFHAPGPEALASFQGRMGAFVGTYSYAPGQSIQGNVFLRNGLTNLAPSSSVQDLTSPGNKSIMALTDGATGFRMGPSPDKIEAYSMWIGKKGVENAVQFTLSETSQVTAVVIVGSFGRFGNAGVFSPGHAVVEIDGHRVADVDDLDAAFVSGFGQVRISFALCRAKVVTLRFPWVNTRKTGSRQEPWLYEIRIEGGKEVALAEASGQVVVQLVDSLTGLRQQVLNTPLRIAGFSSERLAFKVSLPRQRDGVHFYRLEASYRQAVNSVPVLSINPTKPLLPITDLRPPNGPGVGLNVSRGFREFYHLGTGTSEPSGGWSSSDDLIWSYSHLMKQIPRKSPNGATRLYLSNSDMRHYITPWCSFPNGELFMPDAAPRIVENLRQTSRWATSKIVQLTFADRWDTGPDMSNMHGWQDYVEFDKFLRALNGTGLTGRTHQECEAQIEGPLQSQWQAWQLERYRHNVQALRDAFEAAGKTLVISAQGVPMVAGKAGRDLSLSIRGMQDDSTWSMLDESPVLTTGRQMSELAFNPVWQMSTILSWGFNSPIFNNWQWHNPVGTTEPSRRHNYDRAWRATLWSGGHYASMYTYGYASNVGTAYTMTEEDYQQWWYMQERESLIAPEAPVGAGLIISTARYADPNFTRFDCGDPLNLEEARILTQSFRNLHNAGVSLPFAANASSLREYRLSAPLILLNLSDFSADELEALGTLHKRGIRLAAFTAKASLSALAADLFSKPGTLIIESSASTLTRPDALRAADQLRATLKLPLLFPPGTAGYGFRSQDAMFVVMEDWLEAARRVELHIDKSQGATAASACNVNDHSCLAVRDSGNAWTVEVPLRSGDGVLIALKESFRGS